MLLTAELRGRLERLSLITRRQVIAQWSGRHASRHKGESLDFADYRPYGSQVTPGWGTSSWFDSEPEAPIAAYAPRTYGYRSTIQETNSARRDSYRARSVVCAARVSASTALPRGGSSWARSAAEKAWRKTVTATHGAAYASFALARGKEWDCSGTIVSRCHVEATPCRSTY